MIDTCVYRVAPKSPVPNFSYAAAIGLFKAVIGVILIVATNQFAKRLKAQTLWKLRILRENASSPRRDPCITHKPHAPLMSS